MAWKTPGSGIYLYLPGTGCLFQFHCRYVDFFGTSSDADDGRDPSVVFVFLPLAGIITYGRWKYKWILGFSTILSLVFVCINIFKPEIHNKTLMPALQSPWFTPHVIVYMFAYAMLGAATVMAVYLLWFKKKGIERHEMALCDNLTYVGLAFMTLGMLSGAVWAKAAWGHYWAWDPKETLGGGYLVFLSGIYPFPSGASRGTSQGIGRPACIFSAVANVLVRHQLFALGTRSECTYV